MKNYKYPAVIVGSIAGIVLPLVGYVAVMTGDRCNFRLIVGYILLLPSMALGHLKELIGLGDNMRVETIAMIVVQMGWYIGIAVSISTLIRRKKMRTMKSTLS